VLEIELLEDGEVLRLVARRDGGVVGTSAVALLTGVNERLAVGQVSVPPEHRRQGIGTALLDALLAELRERGRDTFESRMAAEGGAGERWAIARGFRIGGPRVLQQLALGEADRAAFEVPAPRGYRAEHWISETPEHLLGSVVATRQSIHEAQVEGSVARTPVWTAELVRARESEARTAKVEQRIVVAVEEATGEVVALTELPIVPAETTARQGDTVVTPAHRGRGIGRFIKAHMLRWLLADRPAVERIDTQTSAGNAHMIRVNEQLGFVVARRMVVVSRSF
jgi:GNAT superfamily N-acetyltransferase